MLRPNKHMNPERTVLALSGVLLSHLRDVRIESYTQLLGVARSAFNGGDAIFVPAVSLLFTLGLLQYHAKADTFEYLEARR